MSMATSGTGDAAQAAADAALRRFHDLGVEVTLPVDLPAHTQDLLRAGLDAELAALATVRADVDLRHKSLLSVHHEERSGRSPPGNQKRRQDDATKAHNGSVGRLAHIAGKRLGGSVATTGRPKRSAVSRASSSPSRITSRVVSSMRWVLDIRPVTGDRPTASICRTIAAAAAGSGVEGRRKLSTRRHSVSAAGTTSDTDPSTRAPTSSPPTSMMRTAVRSPKLRPDLGNDDRQVGVDVVPFGRQEIDTRLVKQRARRARAEIRFDHVEIGHGHERAFRRQIQSEVECNLGLATPEVADENCHPLLQQCALPK